MHKNPRLSDLWIEFGATIQQTNARNGLAWLERRLGNYIEFDNAEINPYVYLKVSITVRAATFRVKSEFHFLKYFSKKKFCQKFVLF